MDAKVKKKGLAAKKKGGRRPGKKGQLNNSSKLTKTDTEIKKGTGRNKVMGDVKELVLEGKEEEEIQHEEEKMVTPRKARYKRRLSVADGQILADSFGPVAAAATSSRDVVEAVDRP